MYSSNFCLELWLYMAFEQSPCTHVYTVGRLLHVNCGFERCVGMILLRLEHLQHMFWHSPKHCCCLCILYSSTYHNAVLSTIVEKLHHKPQDMSRNDSLYFQRLYAGRPVRTVNTILVWAIKIPITDNYFLTNASRWILEIWISLWNQQLHDIVSPVHEWEYFSNTLFILPNYSNIYLDVYIYIINDLQT